MTQENLGAFLTHIIAEKEGVPEEQITSSWIHEQREKRFYPKIRKGSEKMEKQADKVLEQPFCV